MVLVYQMGIDLFVGWTMWRSRSTVMIVMHLIRDMFQGGGVGKGLAAEVRAAEARALRELIHSVTREGVLAAMLEPPMSAADVHTYMAQLKGIDGSALPQSAATPPHVVPTQSAPPAR